MIEYGLLLVAIAGLFYLYRADFSHYSIFTVGVYKRLHRYKARNTDNECYESMCDRTVIEGETRKACKEIVLCGCPLLRYDVTENVYCNSHGSFEYQQGDYDVTTTQKVATSIESGLRKYAAYRTQKEENKGPFDDVITAAASTWNLVGIAFIVLIAALIVGFSKSIVGDTA